VGFGRWLLIVTPKYKENGLHDLFYFYLFTRLLEVFIIYKFKYLKFEEMRQNKHSINIEFVLDFLEFLR
jgi:hypothetical protein